MQHMLRGTGFFIMLIVWASALWAQRTPSSCVVTDIDCTEMVPLDSDLGTLVYRTRQLDVRDESVIRAVVVVHGAERDARLDFRTVLAAAFLANALDETLIVSPRLASNDHAASLEERTADETTDL